MCSLRRRALNRVRRLVKSKPVRVALYSVLLVGCQKHTVVSRNYMGPDNADNITSQTSPSFIKTIAPTAPGNYNASLMNFLAHIPEKQISKASQQLVEIFEDHNLPNKSFENFTHSSLLSAEKKKQFVSFITEHSLIIFEKYFTELLKEKFKTSNIQCRLDFVNVDSKKMKKAISEEYFLGEFKSSPQWEALPHMVPNFKSGDYEISMIKQDQYIFKWSAICSSKADVLAQLLTGYYSVHLSTYSLEPRFEDSRPYFIQSIDKLSTSPLDKLHINSNINKDFRVQEIVPGFNNFFLSYSR